MLQPLWLCEFFIPRPLAVNYLQFCENGTFSPCARIKLECNVPSGLRWPRAKMVGK